MLLLTGATGLVGSALLRRLVAEGAQVRCLVRDPRRLGRAARARADRARRPHRPAVVSQRAARRATRSCTSPRSIRDQPQRVDRGAQRDRDLADGARRPSAPGVGALRVLLRARRLDPPPHALPSRQGARRAGGRARPSLDSIVFAPSIVYAPGDPWLTLLERLALLPVMPMSGRGRARIQPIWAEDVADCAMAALRATRGANARALRARGPGDAEPHRDRAPRAALARSPAPARERADARSSRARCACWRATLGRARFATWDEAELMEVLDAAARGGADVEAPRRDAQADAGGLGVAEACPRARRPARPRGRAPRPCPST